jgi:NitT/TauT family transport system substrate-binding protein
MKINYYLAKLLFAVLLAALFGPAQAQEIKEINIAKQYGISYLPLMLMEHDKLLEKLAKQAGLGDITVHWSTFAGGAVMNDAMLSGNLHFASGGVGPLLTLWARTRGNLDVRGAAAMNSMPLYLNCRNPNVRTLKDLTEKDKIALPAVKVSIQAVTLQMAAEKAFGAGQQNKLDPLTVTMSHPDGQLALLSGASEITCHFSSPPFQYQQLERPGIHTVLNSYEVLGGPATFNVVWATNKFRETNPRTYDAFVKAFEEAINVINKDKRGAAELYLSMTKGKDPVDFILKMLNDPNIVFTMTPQSIMKYADFMFKTGGIKVKPASWKDMFFPNVYNLPGS